MKYDYFFKLAKEAGITDCELRVSTRKSINFSLFHSEMESYEVNNCINVSARGFFNNKMGSASCDVWNKKKAKYLVDEIISNAQIIEDKDPVFLFAGSPKYKRINQYNKSFNNVTMEQKISAAYELEKLIKNVDDKIIEVSSVDYVESDLTYTIINTKGLKLSRKSNSFEYSAYALGELNNQKKSGGAFFLDNDFSKFNIEDLAKDVVKNTVSQLGGYPCASKKYNVVIDREAVACLVESYISSANAEEVQKKTSLFIDKLNKQIASKLITIEDRPLEKTLYARTFDDEGVATYNKPIIKKGVLLTYLHNLTTAKKANTTTTGNAYGSVAKMGVACLYTYVKPGKKTLEQIFESINEGVYITDLTGLHSGLDSQTGNFSLQASGFYIKDGKKDHPLDVITLSGNLISMFKHVGAVANDMKLLDTGTATPSIMFKNLSVTGK